MLISTGHLGSFGSHLFSSSSLAFFCDLSLAVALTLDFVIATHSPKQTLHAGCLCVFPVCSISASWTLKAWSPSLGNSAQKKTLHFTLSGIKVETAGPDAVPLLLYLPVHMSKWWQYCRAAEYPLKSAALTYSITFGRCTSWLRCCVTFHLLFTFAQLHQN